jgi:hypothetical protein
MPTQRLGSPWRCGSLGRCGSVLVLVQSAMTCCPNELAPVPRGLLLAWERGAPRRLRRHRRTPAASWKGHCAFGSARCSSWSTQALFCDTSCCVGAHPDRANPIDAGIADREAVRSRPLGEHVGDLGNVRGRGAGGPPPPVLVGIGMHADCENAALSPPDVGDAIPACAVEGRALSGP